MRWKAEDASKYPWPLNEIGGGRSTGSWQDPVFHSWVESSQWNRVCDKCFTWANSTNQASWPSCRTWTILNIFKIPRGSRCPSPPLWRRVCRVEKGNMCQARFLLCTRRCAPSVDRSPLVPAVQIKEYEIARPIIDSLASKIKTKKWCHLCCQAMQSGSIRWFHRWSRRHHSLTQSWTRFLSRVGIKT